MGVPQGKTGGALGSTGFRVEPCGRAAPQVPKRNCGGKQTYWLELLIGVGEEDGAVLLAKEGFEQEHGGDLVDEVLTVEAVG